MSELPLVTAICPTANRQAFLPQAIRYFQQQTYPNRQLLIVSDGGEDNADIIPSDPRIDYVRLLTGKRTIGAKRNICCSMASGEIICHWDDDDAYSPNRITDQVTRLLSSGAPVTGYNTMNFVDGDRAWQYRGSANYVLGVSLCYTKAFWKLHPFQPDIEWGEDNEFQKIAPTIAVAPGDQFIAARVHDANTCPKRATLRDAVWSGANGDMWREITPIELAATGYPWN